MKLSHRCIVTRLRLGLSQTMLGKKILSRQSQVAEFEDGNYRRLNKRSVELLDGLLLDIDYDDLTWEEMAWLKLRENRITVSKMSRKLNIPVSQISLVLNGKALGQVSPHRIREVRRFVDTLGLTRIAIATHPYSPSQ